MAERSGFRMWKTGMGESWGNNAWSRSGDVAISLTAFAATSTGSQASGSFSSCGKEPVTLTLESINGQASVMFQIPFRVSPHSWPMRRTLMRPFIRVVMWARSQMASATHLERE